MSQRQEEARELAQQEMYAELRDRSQPLRDEIKKLEVERENASKRIAELEQKIKDMYEGNRDFLLKL